MKFIACEGFERLWLAPPHKGGKLNPNYKGGKHSSDSKGSELHPRLKNSRKMSRFPLALLNICYNLLMKEKSPRLNLYKKRRHDDKI